MRKTISEEENKKENKEIKILNQKISKCLIEKERLYRQRMGKDNPEFTFSEKDNNKRLEVMYKRKNEILGIKTAQEYRRREKENN